MGNRSFFGIGLAALAILVAVVYLLVYLSLFLGNKIYGFEADALFSLGQLVVEILLIPIVVIGFYIAVYEFRASIQTPKLDLFWEPQTNRYEKSVSIVIPSGTGGVQTPRLVTHVTQPRAAGKARIAMSATGEKPVTAPPNTTEPSTDNGSCSFAPSTTQF